MKTKHIFLFLTLITLQHFSIGQCNVIIDQDFNHWNDHQYTVADAKSDFNNQVKPWTASTYRGLVAPGAATNLIGDVKQETWVVNGELRAEFTKNDAGGYAGGFLFDPYFDGIEEAYLEYKVKFDENFFWATGGKLPGLGGSTSGINSETTGRGTIPSGCKYNTNGWSARLMWRRNRAQTNTPYLILYSYFAERENGEMREDGDCGDAKRIYTGLEDDTWYTIRQYIKLNTPGQKDGIVVMWINGVETYRDSKALIRNAGKNNLKINALIMNTYRGGSRTDPVWHSPRDEFAFFDDFKVWTNCSQPSPNQAPTGSFIEPSFTSIDEDYQQLYVNVEATDPDGDDLSITLFIDNNEIRKEGAVPYEWGHQSANQNYTTETLGLTVGEHQLKVVIEDSEGASSTIYKTITVNKINQAPSIKITSPGNGDSFFVGEEILVKTLATDDGSIDRVNFKLDGVYYTQDQTSENNQFSAIYTFTHPGEYIIGARAFDNEEKSTETTITITIKETPITGLNTEKTDLITVYPNPSQGWLHFNKETSWVLYSIQGIQLDEGKGIEIDLSEFSKGLFLLQLEDKIISIIHQ